MLPVYGLAECSVGLTFSPLGREPRIDTIDRATLARDGVARPLAPDAGGVDVQAVVGCGLPLAGHEIRVVDGANRELPERHQGRLQFRGPSATSGYYRNPERTATLFAEGWVETGDLAYIAGGELFLTGRSKDLIIRAGRNIYPAELEHAIGELDGVRNGCVAVFASTDARQATERLVVVAETRRREADAREKIAGAIRDCVIDIIGMPPDAIELVKPNSVLKTSSGKIRRAATAARYASGRLEEAERALWLQVATLVAAGVGPQCRRALRAAGTIVYAGYAWAVFSVLGSLAWLVALPPLPRAVTWALAHRLARVLRVAAAVPLAQTGRPPPPATVIVANHQSYLDGPLLLSLLPHPVTFVVKGELAAHWYLRIPLRHLGVRFVDRFDRARGAAEVDATVNELRADEPLVVFPEGTFKRMPGLLPFRLGAFATAARSGRAIVPIAIHGTRSILRAGSWLPRRGAVRVVIGDPVAPDAALPEWPGAIALRDAARRHILGHCGEPDLVHESNVVDEPTAPA